MTRLIMLFGVVGVFLLSSCLMRKVEYVKDMTPDSLYTIKASQAIKIQENDRLGIVVHSKNIELAAPFNTDLGGYSLRGEVDLIKDVNSNEKLEKGYLVDQNGNIEFPILGKIRVQGLSTEEISSLIGDLIKKNHYLEDPEVKVSLLNFKIMTMGIISNTIIPVPEGKINLFQAIVKAGGLTINSDAQNVMVIREEGDKRIMLKANVEEYDVFDSEAFNLQQNDIVYVAPKYKQLSPGTQSTWQLVGMLFGIVSLGLSASALFIKK